MAELCIRIMYKNGGDFISRSHSSGAIKVSKLSSKSTCSYSNTGRLRLHVHNKDVERKDKGQL